MNERVNSTLVDFCLGILLGVVIGFWVQDSRFASLNNRIKSAEESSNAWKQESESVLAQKSISSYDGPANVRYGVTVPRGTNGIDFFVDENGFVKLRKK